MNSITVNTYKEPGIKFEQAHYEAKGEQLKNNPSFEWELKYIFS